MDLSRWIGRVLGGTGLLGDIGGGAGHLEYNMPKVYPEIQVIHGDYSYPILKYSKGMFSHSIVNLSAVELPFRSASFKGLFFGDILEHVAIDLLVQTFQEAKRVLSPGGVIFVRIPNRITWTDKIKDEPTHLWIPTVNELDLLLRLFGFTEIDVFTRGFPFSDSFFRLTGKDFIFPNFGTSILASGKKPTYN